MLLDAFITFFMFCIRQISANKFICLNATAAQRKMWLALTKALRGPLLQKDKIVGQRRSGHLREKELVYCMYSFVNFYFS